MVQYLTPFRLRQTAPLNEHDMKFPGSSNLLTGSSASSGFFGSQQTSLFGLQGTSLLNVSDPERRLSCGHSTGLADTSRMEVDEDKRISPNTDRVIIDLTMEDVEPATNALPWTQAPGSGMRRVPLKPEPAIVSILDKVAMKRMMKVTRAKLDLIDISERKSFSRQRGAPIKRATSAFVKYLLFEISGLAYDIAHGNVTVSNPLVLFLVKVLSLPSKDLSGKEYEEARSLFPGVMVHGITDRAPIEHWISGHRPIPLSQRRRLDSSWGLTYRRPIRQLRSAFMMREQSHPQPSQSQVHGPSALG
jgi:hypothetical protein